MSELQHDQASQTKPNHQVPNSLVRLIAGTVALSALAVGVNTIAEHIIEQNRPTSFSSVSDAMNALAANVAAHGDDSDYRGGSQRQMERDLGGAVPSITRHLGEQVVDIAAAHAGTYQTPDGKTVIVSAASIDDGKKDSMGVEAVSPWDGTRTIITLTRDSKDGSFRNLYYDQGPADTTVYIGGPHFSYDFETGKFINSNTWQYADGTPAKPHEGAIIVKGSSLSPYTAAGPATAVVLEDFRGAQQALDLAEQLPHK